MEVAGKRELLGLRGAEGGDAGDLQRQPQAQRAEMARELGRQVGGRRADVRFTEGADVLGARAERVEQVLAVADQRRAGTVWQEQSLVRVERDAVGLVDPAQQRPSLVAERE